MSVLEQKYCNSSKNLWKKRSVSLQVLKAYKSSALEIWQNFLEILKLANFVEVIYLSFTLFSLYLTR